jgi:hypothetical protein
MTLERRFLKGGEYRIRLYPSDKPDGAPAAEFALRIEDRPPED